MENVAGCAPICKKPDCTFACEEHDDINDLDYISVNQHSTIDTLIKIFKHIPQTIENCWHIAR